MEKVLVGLSGGADSALTALLLREQGYEVFGAYLSFCPLSDPTGAKRVAEKLGIPLSVVHREKAFREKVIRPFVRTYCSGKTPNPCVECNRRMKIPELLKEADRLGIEKVATGHYARVERDPSGRMILKKGKDEKKDQSYFLWKLTQKQLARILFPLEDKEKAKEAPRIAGLLEKKQKESMEICFIPDQNVQKFIAENGGELLHGGTIVDVSGKVLGNHDGIFRYTVGQRRGLGVAMGERYFVTEIRPETSQVVLGKEEDLLVRSLRVEKIHFVSATPKTLPREGICMKGRHRGQAIPCDLEWCGREVKVHFPEPIRAFSPGQSACFYEGERLLFGGIISR